MRHPRLRTALRVIGITLLSVIGLVVILVGAGAVAVRSQWGQKKLLSVLLPVINNALTGRVEIGGLGGDIFHRLVLRDVRLYDSESVLSASVGEASARYNLLALLHKDLHITHAQVDDAWVRARFLRDGQLNLGALLKPRPPSGPLPITITVDDAVVDLGAKFDPKEGSGIPPADVQLHVEAAARIFDPHITAELKKLSLHTQAPLEAQIDLSGGVAVLKGSQPQVEAKNLKLRVQTTGEQANRLAPAAELQGNFELALAFHGPLTWLGIDGGLRLPKGLIDLHANVGALDPKLPWQLQLGGQGIDPAAARPSLPVANIDLQVEGKGQGAAGRVELRKLVVSSLGASLNASGFAEGNAAEKLGFPLPQGLAAQLMLNVAAPELREVTKPFAPPSLKLAGAVKADVKVAADKGQLRVDLNVDGSRLQAAGNSVQRLALSLHSVDLLGQLKLHADAVQSPVKLTRLDLDAGMSREALSVRAQGMDYKQLVFALAVAGQPRMDGQKLLSLQAKLNQLFLSRMGQRLDLAAPATIALDMQHPDGPIVDLSQLALRLNQQRLTLAGHFEAKPQRFRASLDAVGINARQWAQIAEVSGVPRTALNLHAHAAGTVKAPEGRLTLGGSIEAMPDKHVPRSELQVAVNLHGQRAQGDVSLKLAQSLQAAQGSLQGLPGGSEPTRVTLRFDAPLALTGALTLDLNAQTQVQSWSELLPEQVRGLRGRIALETRLRGTLQQPELALSVKVPSWGLEKLRGIGTAVELTYGHELLSLHLDSELATLPVAQLATVMLRAQTRLKLGLGTGSNPVPTAAELKRQALSGVMVVDASVLKVDLPKLLAQVSPAQAADPALLSGQLSATIHAEGTPEAPKLQVKVDAKELATDIPSVHNLAVNVDARYAGNTALVDVAAGLPNQPLVKLHAESDVPMERVLNGTLEPKGLPARAKVQVLPFELSQISQVRGKITAEATVQGTVGLPEVTSWVRSESVQMDNFIVGPVAVNATLDREHLLKADVDLKQKSGDLKLTAQSSVPPRLEGAQLNLTAQNFSVDYNPTPGKIRLKDPLGMVKGVLNADLHVQGTSAGPSVRGYLKLEKGGLVMKALQQALGDINVDLQITPPGQGSRRTVVALKEARLNADQGKASVKGSVELEGTRLNKLNFDASAQNFPVWAGVIALWADAKVNISGHVNGDTLRIDVHIPDGGVRLPKFQTARSVQPLGPFEGVTLVGRKAQQQALAAEKKAEEKAEKRAEHKEKAAERAAAGEQGFIPPHIQATVQLPEAFRVSGPELHAELNGRIELNMDSSGIPRITGQVRNSQSFGWVEILKRRYEIDRIETSLAGENPPNPLFNIEISRKLDETTIYITVTGSARKPKITFRSDPPLLDESQIIATILTGERGSSSGDVQAMGILSSLLIGQLRDQLADRLPIDVLRVDVAGDDPMGVNQSSLEVGKYLRDNVYLGYKRRFGSATTGLRRLNADEVILEYNFFRNYKIKTLYGDANVGAIDLYWTRRF